MILKNKSSFDALPKRTPVPLGEPLHWVRFFNFNNMEIWKDIPGYKGYYQISDLGNVRSLDRLVNSKDGRKALKKGKYLKHNPRNGYLSVALQKEGKVKIMNIHRLVMLTFVGKSNLYVNHIDFNKKNNRLSNLEYVTAKENSDHFLKVNENPSAVLQRVKVIDTLTGIIYKSQIDAAKELYKDLGCSSVASCLSRISQKMIFRIQRVTE